MFALNRSLKNVQAKGEYVIIGVSFVLFILSCCGARAQLGLNAASRLRFVVHEQIETPTAGRIPLNE